MDAERPSLITGTKARYLVTAYFIATLTVDYDRKPQSSVDPV
jgi:hypothetical protein